MYLIKDPKETQMARRRANLIFCKHYYNLFLEYTLFQNLIFKDNYWIKPPTDMFPKNKEHLFREYGVSSFQLVSL